jgi:hypothetical protein
MVDLTGVTGINMDAILFKKEDMMHLLRPYVKFISDHVLKEIGDGAYAVAQKGHFWNTEMFKSFMKETMNELFFAKPEASKKFKDMIDQSMKTVFEEWLRNRLKEKDLEILFEGMARRFIEDEKLREILSMKPVPPSPEETQHVELLKSIKTGNLSDMRKGKRKK